MHQSLRTPLLLILAALGAAGCSKPQATLFPEPVRASDVVDQEARRRAAEAAAAAAAAEAEAAARAQAQADSLRRVREEASNSHGVRDDLLSVVYFQFDQYQIVDADLPALRRKAEILRQNPSLQIQVEGHADERGYPEYNLALAQRRAAAVRAAIAGYGIDPTRISTLSWGQERPAVPSARDENSHALNRRVEFRITSGTFR